VVHLEILSMRNQS